MNQEKDLNEEQLTDNEDSMWNKSDEELEAEYNKLKESETNKQELEPGEEAEINSIKQELEQPDNNQDSNTEDKPEEIEEDSNTEQPKKSSKGKSKTLELKPLKALGKEIPIDNIDELYTLASKGVDYTKKMQQLSPFRGAMELMQNQGITDDDLNLLVDIKKGNKDAVKKLIKDIDLDVYDEYDPDEEVQYTPNNYVPDEINLQLKEVEDRISADKEYETTLKVIETMLDTPSKEMLMKNPKLIEGLHNDIKSGLFFEVEPLVTKQRLLSSGSESYIDLYAKSVNEFINKTKSNEVAKVQSNQQQQQQKNQVKQRASINQSPTTPQRSYADYHINYDDMSDEEFDALYNSIMDR